MLQNVSLEKAYLNPGIHIFRILFMLKNHTSISLHQNIIFLPYLHLTGILIHDLSDD